MKPFHNFYLLLLLTLTLFVGSKNATANATENPTHYIVFSQSDTKQNLPPTPLYYEAVSVRTPLQSLSKKMLEKRQRTAERNKIIYVVQLFDKKNQLLFQNSTTLSKTIRGEFHSSTGTGIDGHFFAQTDQPFVVRVPIIANTTLVIMTTEGVEIGRYALNQLSQNTPRALSSKQTKTSLATQGDASNRLDLLVMGDGFTNEANFIAQATTVMDSYFNISPLAKYRNYFNTINLYTPSNEQGADHPSCPEYDPLAGTYVDTAFDGFFCYYNLQRLTGVDKAKVLAEASRYPDWDKILVILNDTTYGGSGGDPIANITLNEAAIDLAQHELGHTLFNLGDEYSDAYPGYLSCDDNDPFNLCEANVTNVNNALSVKWRAWFDGTVPIPTSDSYSNYTGVALFEGARYFSTGMYRPSYNCMMRSLGQPFCQVASEAIVKSYYEGGWGVPAEGISMIEPNTQLPATNSITVNQGDTASFSFGLLEPVGRPSAEISWTLNDIPIATGNKSLNYLFAEPAGTYTLKATVKDPTSFVLAANAGNSLTFSTCWQVTIVGQTTPNPTSTSSPLQTQTPIATPTSVVATNTPRPTTIPTLTPTATPTSSASGCTAPAWDNTIIYLGDSSLGSGKGEVVSHNGKQWRAKWWTQGNEPGTNDVWLDLGECAVTSTATPIPTNTSTPIPTNTSTPIPTNTATPLPTNTSTPIPTNTATPLPANTATPIPTTVPLSIRMSDHDTEAVATLLLPVIVLILLGLGVTAYSYRHS